MSDAQTTTGLPPHSLPVDAQLEIDAFCEEYEQAWRAGRQPQIDEIVSRSREAVRMALRAELAIVAKDLINTLCTPAAPGRPASVEAGYQRSPADTSSEPGDNTLEWRAAPDVVASPSPPGYELLEELGRGGMGVVYKARQVGLDRLVALKMIRTGEMASREEMDRFRAEAQAAGSLQHLHIVPVYEIGEYRGMPYFSMAFVPGVSLKDHIGAGPLKPRKAAELIRQVADAVAYAHERGIVHRDLKPANILLNHAGEPCITDFGLAKRVDQGSDFTGTGQILGTPSYMPPEQALGQTGHIGPLADVYALGATLYHLLTGRPPFQSASPIETIKQVIDTEAVPPRRLNAEVDRDLDTVCMKCLEKAQGNRYASARELADELARYLNHEPIQARRAGPLVRTLRWCQRKPLAATLVGVSAAAAIGGAALLMRLFATQALAESHQYFSEIGSARKAIEGAAPEWTRLAASNLATAARVRPAGADPAELRTAALRLWNSWDVRRIKSLTTPEQVGAAAFSPDGERFALAEGLRPDSLTIGLYDVKSESLSKALNINVWADNAGAVLQGLVSGRTTGLRNRQTFRAATFSRDGKWLAAGTRSGKIHLWPCAAMQVIVPERSWQAHDGEIEQLAYSPDHQILYSTETAETSVKRWSMPLGTPLPDLLGEHQFVAASPDGRWIATGNENVRLFDAATLQPGPAWNLPGTSVAFSSDSRLLAAGMPGGESLQLIDVATGRVIRRLRDPALVDAEIDTGLAFADQDRLLLSSCSDGRARIWDVHSGSLLTSAVAAGKAYPDAAIHPDGRRLTVSGNLGTTLYELVPPEIGQLAAVGSHAIEAIEFVPGGSLLAVSLEHRRSDSLIRRAHLQMWDTEINRVDFDTQVRELPKTTESLYEPVGNHIAFHPQGTEAVWSSSRANLRLKRNPRLPQPAFTLELGPLGGAVLEEDAFTPGGDTSLSSIQEDLAAANGKALRLAPGGEARVVLGQANLDALEPAFACYAVARVEGARTDAAVFEHRGWFDEKPWKNREIFGWDVPSDAYHLFQVEYERWPIDGQRPKIELLLRASTPAGLKAIWVDRLLFMPIATPHVKGAQGHHAQLAELGPFAYAPEGDRLWGIEEHQPRCWSLENLKQPFHVPTLLTALTHGDDVLRSVLGNAKLGLVGARRGDLFLLSPHDGSLQRSEFRPDTAISQVVLHPDGRRAVAATEQGLLWQFSLPEMATIEVINAHGQKVTSLACSRDGSVLVSGSQDRTVHVWSWREEGLVERFQLGKLTGPVKAVRISDDKRRLAALLEQEPGVRVWKLDELNERFDQLRAKVDELP